MFQTETNFYHLLCDLVIKSITLTFVPFQHLFPTAALCCSLLHNMSFRYPDDQSLVLLGHTQTPPFWFFHWKKSHFIYMSNIAICIVSLYYASNLCLPLQYLGWSLCRSDVVNITICDRLVHFIAKFLRCLLNESIYMVYLASPLRLRWCCGYQSQHHV